MPSWKTEYDSHYPTVVQSPTIGLEALVLLFVRDTKFKGFLDLLSLGENNQVPF
jgi:hypothetical protein